jgi:alcohol dehydrogenase class IV
MGWFHYGNPPAIYWGAGCATRLSDEARDAHRVFVVTTRSVERTLGAQIEGLLGGRMAGRFSAIGQHAPISDVRAAAAAARAVHPDLLVSVGGGSVIDAAKTVAFMLATGDALEDLEAVRGLEPEALPHLALPTTLSAAEMDGAAGFTDGGEKTGVHARTLIPRAVFYDPELALHTPLGLWLSTGMRAIDHAIEGLLSPENNPLSEGAALESLARLPPALRATKKDPADLVARGEAQLGAWLSMTLPLASARGLGHMLGKRIGARHGIPHGVTSCLLLPHVLRDYARRAEHHPMLAKIARALGGDDEADALADLIAELELPHHLREYSLSDPDLRAAAEPLARRAHRPVEELINIYKEAW